MPLYSRQLLCGFLLLGLFAQQARAQVLIDAGHGPKSVGSTSFYGKQEHIYTEKMKHRVLFHLSRLNIPASGLSQNDTLEERAKTQGTLLVSLHYDSVPQSMRDNGLAETKAGYSVLVSRKNAYYIDSVRCAQSVGQSMHRFAGEKKSDYRNHLDGFRTPYNRIFGVHIYDNLRLLRQSVQPALLVELGMWVNSKEEPRLLSPQTMDKQALAIVKGIQKCLPVLPYRPKRTDIVFPFRVL